MKQTQGGRTSFPDTFLFVYFVELYHLQVFDLIVSLRLVYVVDLDVGERVIEVAGIDRDEDPNRIVVALRHRPDLDSPAGRRILHHGEVAGPIESPDRA